MKRSILKRIFSYLRPYRGSLVLGCISAVLQVAFTLMTPVLIGCAIDCLIGPGLVQFRHLAVLLAVMALCILLAAGFQWVMNVCIRRISALAAQDMRQQAFNALNAVPISTIDQLPHGDLVSRLVNDTDAVSEGLLQGLTQLLPGAATILGVLVIMFYLNPFIALVVVLVTPLSILFARFVASRTHALFRKQAAAQGQLSAYVNEMVNGQDLVKAFGHEAQCCETFDRINEELRSASLWAVFYSAAANPGTRFVNNIVYGAVGVFGGLAALSGALSVGTLSAFLTYANQISALNQKALQEIHMHKKFRATLRVGCAQWMYDLWLGTLLVQFSKRFPDISLHVEIEHSENMIPMLQHKLLDLAFIAYEINNSSVVSCPFQTTDILLVGAPSVFGGLKGGICKQDLAQIPLIYSDIWDSYLEDISKHTLSSGMVFRVHSNMLASAKQFCLAGTGCCFLPAAMLEQELEEGTLIRIPIYDLPVRSVDTYIAYQRGNTNSEAIKDWNRYYREAASAAK